MKPLFIAAAACLAVGAASTVIGVIVGDAPGLAFAGAFVAAPFIVLVFFAVRVVSSAPSVIVSDRGIETMRTDVQRVVLWPEVASVWLELDGRSTTLVYESLEALVDDDRAPVRLPPIPNPRGEDAAGEWDDLLRRFAESRYEGIREVPPADE